MSKKLTEEHKNNISIARKGFKMSQEQKDKLSVVLKGKPAWNKGKKLSQSHIENLIKSHIGLSYPKRKKNKLCFCCGNTIKLRGTKRKFCSHKCYSKNISLSGSYLWKGGKSFEIYPIGWNNTFKEQIRYRDGYKCQLCGKPEIENCRKLDVHHIDYNKQNISEKNLTSLCKSCHIKTNNNREYWKEYFCNLLRRKEL
jgi:hypothetical protein